jgi:Tol biopolymer transport system component
VIAMPTLAGLLAALLLLALGSSPAPSWAAFPGGNGRIAFQGETVAGDHTQSDIYTVGRDGTGVRRLADTPNRDELGPAWSPNGSRLAFWRTAAPFGTGSLWVMNADGSGKRQLTFGVDARDPAWNPAGNRLVYDQVLGGDLYTLRVSDGLDRRRLTSGAALDFEPAWSPGGRRVAFTRGTAAGDPGDIFLVDVVTGQVQRVTSSPAFDHQVAWAPGAGRLVFQRDFDQSSAIFTVRPDGTGLARLTSGAHFDIAPAWAPDGTEILFGSDRLSLLHELWTMHRDGTDQRRLLGNPTAALGFPDWQPVP